ncbi:hypothetical protein TH25_23720 [Thalassospira profundimaris]|uniref:Tle cognate immunity protein 4 C-terminal domain-containing protein n=1 Tax=Thalassospira profundimaris TaxID=502049 RepID=A0A367WJ35_9PROT|nr:hypothetical protein [Thalassospira profundimaris]RCK41438.1 hypothetical protein TH25_23720 [Thalassospira profundimaris]
MFEKLVLHSRKVLMLVLCTLVMACKQEADVDTINIDDVKVDTSDWRDYCVGYHSLKIPPGLKPSFHPATNIDWQYPHIERNFQGSALDYIHGHERFGEAVFSTRVNGWDFVVAKEQRSRRISDNSLVFFGAKKVADDVLSFSQDASVSIVGDGSDPKYRTFYENLNAEPATEKNKSTGFCYDGYVFSGYNPRHLYDFTVDILSGSEKGRHGFELVLSQKMESPKSDDRPLAPVGDINMFPNIIQSEQEDITGGRGYRGSMTHIWDAQDGADRHWIKALFMGPKKNVKTPLIAIETIGDIRARNWEHDKKEFLGFLGNIKPN